MHSILFITRVDRAYLVSKILAYMSTKIEKTDLVVLSDDRWNSCQWLVNYFVYMPSNVNQEEFLIKIIKKYNVKGIFVASSYDLMLLRNIEHWLFEHKILYYTPEKDSLRICLSKYEQYHFLTKIGVLTPCVYDYEDIILNNRNDVFPLIVKPIYGQGSKEVSLVSNKKELEEKIHNKDFLIQERIEGLEYTVDCFTDKKGELLLCVPRIRVAVLGAHAVAVKIQLDEKIFELAMKINGKLKIYGPWNFQLFKNEKRLIVHDINPRIANGIIFSIEAGAAFDKLIVNHLIEESADNGASYIQCVKDGIELWSFNTCCSKKI